MKRFLSAILVIGILLSMAIIPAAAVEEGYVRTFDELLCYEFEKVPNATGWTHFSIPGHKYFGDSYCFSAYPAQTPTMEVTDKFGTGDPGILVKAEKDGTNISYSTLRNDYPSDDERNSEKGQEFLSGDFAISFQAATTQYASISLNIYGDGGANVLLNKIAPDGEKIISGKLTDYKVIFDKDTNSYVIYVDNRFYKEGSLKYSNDLHKFNLVAYIEGAKAKTAGVEAYAFFNDFALYIISDEDNISQYYVKDSENGKIDVSYGIQQAGNEYSYTVTPNEGYVVTKVTVGGEVQEGIAPEGGTYTFTANPGENNVISAEYGSYSYTVEESEGGTIVINDDITGVGQEVSYTITPNEGYTVKSVTIGGEIQEGIAPEGGTYTFITKIGENNVISAEYLTYLYEAKESEYGTVVINEEITQIGQTVSYTVTPNEGYIVNCVTIGGVVQEGIAPEGGTYTFTAQAGENNVISAEFRKFKKIAEYDGNSVPISGWKHWTVKTNEEFPADTIFSTWASAAANITMTSEDKFEEGNTGTLVRPQEGMDATLNVYMFNIDNNSAPNSDKGLEIRNGHTALTFKAALSENAQLKVNVSGFATTTDFSAGVPTKGSYLSYMLETGKTGVNASSYNHTKDVEKYTGTTSLKNVIKRDTLQEYKFIFDYDNGTYDLYIDNKLVAEDRVLGGGKYLLRYYVSISAYGTANKDAYGFIDDVRYYTLTSDDLTAQYTAEESAGGKIVINDAITAAGKEASFTITPNEGYTVKSVTAGGETIEGIAPEGGTYTFTAKAGLDNVISAEYDTYRVFKKEFALDFEANNEGSWIGGSGAVKSFVKCPANNVSYGNYYSYANASGEIISENGNKMLKINLPAKAEGAEAIAYNRINFLWEKDETFGKFTTEPFAISFKLGLEDGVNAALDVYDRGEDSLGSSIFFDAGADVISNYDYEQINDLKYSNISTYRDLSGIHEYKLVVNPKDATYDMYIDGDLVAENVHLRSASMLYYFRLIVRNAKGEEDKTAYLDDFSLWLLTNEHTDIQPDVNQTGNGRAVTSEAVVKKGEEVTYELIPDEGSYIKNVYINGAPIAAFCADSVSVVISDTTKRNVVDVEFADYEEGKPSVYRTPFAAKVENAMYLFFKLGANGVTADSFGIVVSKTNKNPDAENGTLVPSEGALTAKGYFGYKLTADEGCYIRPYVKSGETIFYGEAEWMHPYKISNLFVK